MPKYNDLDPRRWKEYGDINTDSLWIIEKRDNSGAHDGHYHGNFVPQIPNQLLRRYTKEGEIVLDPFMGSGTTIIEAQRLKRNSIGVDLQQSVVDEAVGRICTERGESVKALTYAGDSMTFDFSYPLKLLESNTAQFIIYHPPYWDIIKFSNNPNDLSNSKSSVDFLHSFGKVIDNTAQYLDDNRYCAVVIGDKYANSRVDPLGFKVMSCFLERGFILKAILVKNFGDTKGKKNQQGIWRYRAIMNDFYIFKHEYIFVFKKLGNGRLAV